MPTRGGSKGKKKPSLHSLSREPLADIHTDAFFEEVFFGPRAILAGFSDQITIAHALGVLPAEMMADLNILRRIRNVFAHRVQPLRFNDPIIAAECAKLSHISDTILELELYAPEEGPRRRYINCCMNLSVSLYKSVLRAIIQTSDDDRAWLERY